jgi:MFS family permease
MPFAVGLLVWSLPIAALGFVDGPSVVFLALAVAGVGRAVMAVAGQTLLQRSAHDETLSRVIGVLEAVYLGAFGLGALLVPGLLAVLGTRPAYAVVGLSLPVLAILLWRSLRSIDRDAAVPVRELDLIRGVAMLAVLSPAAQERLARRLVPEAFPADAWVIREGEAGDRFYVVDSGQVEVTVGGRELRRLGPGGSFGEIALLRDSPRTASVRALTAVQLFGLERAPFLSAVTRLPESRIVAAGVVAERLATG